DAQSAARDQFHDPETGVARVKTVHAQSAQKYGQQQSGQPVLALSRWSRTTRHVWFAHNFLPMFSLPVWNDSRPKMHLYSASERSLSTKLPRVFPVPPPPPCFTNRTCRSPLHYSGSRRLRRITSPSKARRPSASCAR